VEALTAQEYEHRAQQCRRLARHCTDPRRLDAIKTFARQYELVAALLRRREDRRATYRDRIFRWLRHDRHEHR